MYSASPVRRRRLLAREEIDLLATGMQVGDGRTSGRHDRLRQALVGRIADGVTPATDGTASAVHFTGARTHRQVPNAGHNLPQESPKHSPARFWNWPPFEYEPGSASDRVELVQRILWQCERRAGDVVAQVRDR